MRAQQQPEQRPESPMSHTRRVVKSVVRNADAPLSAAAIRHLAQQRDPSLNGVMVAIAVADLKHEGKIRVSG